MFAAKIVFGITIYIVIEIKCIKRDKGNVCNDY